MATNTLIDLNETSSYISNKPNTDQNKHQQLEPPPSSSSFAETVARLLLGRSKRPTSGNTTTTTVNDTIIKSSNSTREIQLSSYPAKEQKNPQLISSPQPAAQAWPKQRACRAPLSRKFAHPCNCGPTNNHHKLYPSHSSSSSNNTLSSNPLPPAAYTNPLHLYDPISKKCLPTSRSRDMLLKDCHTHVINTFPLKPHHQTSSPCVYDDLVCDTRRFRCVCKPSLHLYYEANLSSFGCVSIGSSSSPDGLVNCRPDYVYNVISKECQKIFDVNDLPPNYTTGVSATQFSFVTIVLIWILLLILIVTAKLRKLRTSNLYRNSPVSERRQHRNGANSYRHQSTTTSAWLHPFIAAVNGHQHMNHHRSALDRRTQTGALDDSTNYNDTDFFLSNGNLRINNLLSDNQFTGSQQSLNNPPPKFEEIYPSCPEAQQQQQQQQHQHQQANIIQPPPPLPTNEDLPSYDEAMKLRNTMPPDPKV